MSKQSDKNNMSEQSNDKKKFYPNRVPSMWVLQFGRCSDTSSDTNSWKAYLVVAAKNVVHARKRMKNSFSNDKFATLGCPSTLNLSETDRELQSFNPSEDKWTDHKNVEDMIDNAWLQPYAENMLVFTTLED